MDFSKKQADPRRHLVGFTLVVLFHAAIVYALVTGLAKKVVDVVRAPIETKVIEEIKKPPPPPPEIVVPPPPKLEAPPPPYIPPPEVQIAVPPPPQPTVTLAPSPTPPPEPVVIVPAPPPPPLAVPVAVAPPPAPPAPPPPKPTVQSAEDGCTRKVKPVVEGADYLGTVTLDVKFWISDGKVSRVEILKERYAPIADRKVKRIVLAALEAAAAQYICPGDGIYVTQQFSITF